MIDLENVRTMDDYRRDIDFEISNLRAAGFSNGMIELWLAGARWATRICTKMQK